MLRYKLIEDDDYASLERKINHLVCDGYVLDKLTSSSIFNADGAGNVYYLAAMVKE